MGMFMLTEAAKFYHDTTVGVVKFSIVSQTLFTLTPIITAVQFSGLKKTTNSFLWHICWR